MSSTVRAEPKHEMKTCHRKITIKPNRRYKPARGVHRDRERERETETETTLERLSGVSIAIFN